MLISKLENKNSIKNLPDKYWCVAYDTISNEKCISNLNTNGLPLPLLSKEEEEKETIL